MSIAFVRLGWTWLLMMALAVELSICIGMGGWGCPIQLRMFRASMAFYALMYNVPSSDLAAEDITVLMISATLRIAPLFWGEPHIL